MIQVGGSKASLVAQTESGWWLVGWWFKSKIALYKPAFRNQKNQLMESQQVEWLSFVVYSVNNDFFSFIEANKKIIIFLSMVFIFIIYQCFMVDWRFVQFDLGF